MNLQNGYKVIYEKAADGKRTFYASKTGVFADADKILEDVAIGEYKLVYEKDGQLYGSTTGIPADSDHCFEEFDSVLKAAEEEATDSAAPNALDEPETPADPVEPEDEKPAAEEPVTETDEVEE